MAVLVIGGSGRGAGKTAVGCALIAAMPELRWLAVKVSSHLHDGGAGLREELDAGSDKDTGRYLAAGARRAFLVDGLRGIDGIDRIDGIDGIDGIGGLTGAAGLVLEARELASGCDAVVIESNGVLAETVRRAEERSATLAVVTGDESEWKASLAGCLSRADAVVLSGGLLGRTFSSAYPRKPVFCLAPGEWSLPDLVWFVRRRLLAGE